MRRIDDDFHIIHSTQYCRAGTCFFPLTRLGRLGDLATLSRKERV
jgi:hypothetical protein